MDFIEISCAPGELPGFGKGNCFHLVVNGKDFLCVWLSETPYYWKYCEIQKSGGESVCTWFFKQDEDEAIFLDDYVYEATFLNGSIDTRDEELFRLSAAVEWQ